MMTLRAKLMLTVLLLAVLLLIIGMVRRRRLELKYVLLWMASDILLIIFVLFPKLMEGLAQFLGIYSQMNMIFFLGLVFTLAIIFSLTVTISRISEKMRRIAQIVAMLPEDVQRSIQEELEKEETKSNEKKTESPV